MSLLVRGKGHRFYLVDWGTFMGHIRLGSVPKTRKWIEVVALIANSGDERLFKYEIERIASQTLYAAEAGLNKAINDIGLRFVFYLLTQLVLSARQSNWQEYLLRFGINLSPDATLFDLLAEMQFAIDKYINSNGYPTDISEMAQQALGEAITTLAGPNTITLFGSGRDELRIAIRALSSKQGFARLGQTFFARFIARYLNFYLSRITAAHLGGNKLRQLGDLSRFNEALKLHCLQGARIVHDFCGDWYSKTEFQQGINLENTSRFMAVAIKKLQAELREQGAKP